MSTILITNNYKEEALIIVKRIIGNEFQVMFLPENTRDCLLSLANQADYILASGRIRIDSEVIESATRLKMIQRTGAGLDSLDLEAIKKHNIPLYVNSGLNSQSVAEYTLLLMLGCLKRIPLIDENTKNGIWKKQEQGVLTRELSGKTVGIIGFGHIGKKVAKMLIPFNTRTVYFSRTRCDNQTEEECRASYMELDELLRISDIVSIHCSLNEQTQGLIDSNSFEIMKKGVILINTSRGQIVDTISLAKNLADGKIAFAGIDVYETEPLVYNSPLLGLKNVILSPHIAGITKESFENMIGSAIRNIRLFELGKTEEIEEYKIV